MTPEEMQTEIARLKQWVSDLQSGKYINCVYCGHRYGPDPGTPGEHWVCTVFGPYADRVAAQPLAERSPFGVEKDVRHFLIECQWEDRRDPVVTLQGLLV